MHVHINTYTTHLRFAILRSGALRSQWPSVEKGKESYAEPAGAQLSEGWLGLWSEHANIDALIVVWHNAHTFCEVCTNFRLVYSSVRPYGPAHTTSMPHFCSRPAAA